MKLLLLPFSLLYGIGVGFRNFLFDIGILKSKRFQVPIICIGNITVGGTGKTPHTELLIETLKEKFRVACLSRGYKRKTSGFRLATPESTAADIGDEPLQIHRKFPDILVACDAKRVRGIEKLSMLPTPPQVILLDDAFQHRYVQADKNIVLIDYNRPVTEDHLLPWGRLRESCHALKRADYIIVTKCPPNLSPIDQRIWSKHLKIKPYQRLFFSMTGYGEIHSLVPGSPIPQPSLACGILCLTGIAQPAAYAEHLKTYSSHITELHYPDHHNFNNKDIQHITQVFQAIPQEEKYIFTTEKDAVRLEACSLPEEIRERLFYIPVVPKFIREQNVFLNEISEYVRKNQK